CTVARLMAVFGLFGGFPGEKVRPTLSRENVAAGDRVKRQCGGESPGPLWGGGFYFGNTREGFVYVGFIIYLFFWFICLF
ncbi:IS3 family transposase, partial [Escherichia coli]|nr:IS3 family transposase [Escherichia coli]